MKVSLVSSIHGIDVDSGLPLGCLKLISSGTIIRPCLSLLHFSFFQYNIPDTPKRPNT